ncbi:MAG: exodeoxyribonuclease VII small subunit [Saprospiraceae bacterium]|nr:exodeoxyribonuclease VII small subunit [Saprospiraceae bacterium]
MKQTKFSYEKAIEELKEILSNVQKDKYTLDEMTEAMDRAQELLKKCEEALRKAQDKVVEIKK